MGRRKREIELFVFIRPAALTTHFSQEPLSSFALLHWSWRMGLADYPCMHDACARRPLHAPGLLLGLFNRVVME